MPYKSREKRISYLVEYRKKNIDSYRKHWTQYNKKNRIKNILYARIWRKTNKDKRNMSEKNRLDKLRYPGKWKSRRLLRAAVESGRMARPTVCSKCTSSKFKIEAHHTDYRKPYQVIWVCPPCHRKIEGRYYPDDLTELLNKSKKG